MPKTGLSRPGTVPPARSAGPGGVYRHGGLVQSIASIATGPERIIIVLPASCLPASYRIADATLRRGTRFFGDGLSAAPGGARGAGRAKVIGNGLRELDRFLSLLIDAAAMQLALADRDRAVLERGRNTARKLTLLRQHQALASPDDAALRAIGRMRDCLFHTGGIVRANGARSAPTAGWAHPETPSAAAPVRLACGATIDPSAQDLHRIGRFYDRIADDLRGMLDINRPPD